MTNTDDDSSKDRPLPLMAAEMEALVALEARVVAVMRKHKELDHLNDKE